MEWMVKWRCTEKGSVVLAMIYDWNILAGLFRSKLSRLYKSLGKNTTFDFFVSLFLLLFILVFICILISVFLYLYFLFFLFIHSHVNARPN